mmetsp:Transcript_902/g.1673  ORF Transcript_902/g.1673 Transcript_902/m.1673 type:complete len:152 (-) Transcript_902:639-1094(-)
MATVVWSLVFAILCIELVATVALCVPLPWGFRKSLLKISKPVQAINAVQTGLLFVLIGLCLALFSSFQTMKYAQDREDTLKFNRDTASVVQVWEYSKIRQEKFRAERNIYLAMMTIVLGFVIRRLFELFHNEANLRIELAQLKEQAQKKSQ